MSYNPVGGLKPRLTQFSNEKYIYVSDRELCGFGILGHHFQQSLQRNLFTRRPCIDDVKQSTLGDCYLLGPLLAILDHPRGGGFINNMMADLNGLHRAGRILVKLFHKADDETIIPIYIEVDNTVLLPADPKKEGHRADWVYFLEKAYAAYQLKILERITESKTKKEIRINGHVFYEIHSKAGEKPTNLLEALKSGYCDDAFLTLTGKIARNFRVRRNPTQTESTIICLLFLIADHTPQRTFASLSPEDQSRYHTVFKAITNLTDDSEDNITQRQSYINCFMSRVTAYNIHRSKELLEIYPYKPLRQYDVTEALSLFVQGQLYSEPCRTADSRLLDIVRRGLVALIKQELPEKRGSKQYCNFHQNTFEFVHRQISLGNMLVITCYSSKPEKAESKGLLFCHTYQIVNCYERAGYKFVLLRNPHRKNTRSYKDIRTYSLTDLISKKLSAYQTPIEEAFKPVAISHRIVNPAKPLSFADLDHARLNDHGVFEVPIEELAKQFSRITYCEL